MLKVTGQLNEKCIVMLPKLLDAHLCLIYPNAQVLGSKNYIKAERVAYLLHFQYQQTCIAELIFT